MKTASKRSRKIKFTFTSNLWKSNGAGAWHFVSLPMELSEHIRSYFKGVESGWGRLSVKVELSSYSWTTSLWFDTKLNTYLLPVNAKARKVMNVLIDDSLEVTVIINDSIL